MPEAREIIARIMFELHAPGDPQWYPYEPEEWLKDADAILAALSSAGLAVVPVTDADLIDNSYLSLIKAETERYDLLTAALDVEADLIAYMLVHAADYSSAGPSVEQYKEMIAKLRAGIGAQGGTK